jgi:hypothetical protein
MGVTHWDDREVHRLQVLFPLQNLLRKLRAGISALLEIKEPIWAELFSSECFELSLYKLNGFRAAFDVMTLWNIL